MFRRKTFKTKGKIKLSRYFQEFVNGDNVTVIREFSLQPGFPQKIQGRTGKVIGKRGEAYIVNINDLNKEKIYIIHPVHLRMLK